MTGFSALVSSLDEIRPLVFLKKVTFKTPKDGRTWNVDKRRSEVGAIAICNVRTQIISDDAARWMGRKNRHSWNHTSQNPFCSVYFATPIKPETGSPAMKGRRAHGEREERFCVEDRITARESCFCRALFWAVQIRSGRLFRPRVSSWGCSFLLETDRFSQGLPSYLSCSRNYGIWKEFGHLWFFAYFWW